MNNMQSFYQWLFKNSGKQVVYRDQLTLLSQTELSQFLTAAGFWGWNFWGSPSGPE